MNPLYSAYADAGKRTETLARSNGIHAKTNRRWGRCHGKHRRTLGARPRADERTDGEDHSLVLLPTGKKIINEADFYVWWSDASNFVRLSSTQREKLRKAFSRVFSQMP